MLFFSFFFLSVFFFLSCFFFLSLQASRSDTHPSFTTPLSPTLTHSQTSFSVPPSSSSPPPVARRPILTLTKTVMSFKKSPRSKRSHSANGSHKWASMSLSLMLVPPPPPLGPPLTAQSLVIHYVMALFYALSFKCLIQVRS